MTQTAELTGGESSTKSTVARWAPQAGLWALGAVILFLYSSLWRPIWFDEFLHYAMGGMTLDYALKTIDYTTIETNHGQTGVYMLLDYLLMQVFGASAVALRLPSLIAAAVMLGAAVTFLRLRGFGFAWRYLALIAFAGHAFLMYFSGEARPYMALAGSTVAALAYYQYDVADRRRVWPIALGVFGICVGALMHPYIVYLLVLILPFSVWMAVRDGRVQWQVRDVVRFLNPVLLAVGAALFVAVGLLTYLRRVARFDYDPLEWMGKSWALTVEKAFSDHFGNPTNAWFWLVAVALVTLIALAVSRFTCSRSILPPLVLILIGVVSSISVSVVSIMRTYWIFDRQWVAGMALVTLGSVWFFAELLRDARVRRSTVLAVPAYVFITLTLVSGAFTLLNQATAMNDARVAYQQFTEETRTMDELRPTQVNDDNAFIYAANVNVARGGPVWPMFVDWYDNLAGMRPEFREKNPSWTGFLGDQRTVNNG
jgi:hypothetical protein